MKTIKIKNRLIGEGHPAYIIAEMSANHAGSIERAKEIIRAAKEAGADCLKIQTYTPDTITINCDNKYFQIDAGTWEGESLYDLYAKAYTPWEWHKELKECIAEIDPSLTIHDFRIVTGPTHTNLIFDVVTPYNFPMSDNELTAEITRRIQKENPSYYTVIEVDKKFV